MNLKGLFGLVPIQFSKVGYMTLQLTYFEIYHYNFNFHWFIQLCTLPNRLGPLSGVHGLIIFLYGPLCPCVPVWRDAAHPSLPLASLSSFPRSRHLLHPLPLNGGGTLTLASGDRAPAPLPPLTLVPQPHPARLGSVVCLCSYPWLRHGQDMVCELEEVRFDGVELDGQW
jgi:hypothetical protein